MKLEVASNRVEVGRITGELRESEEKLRPIQELLRLNKEKLRPNEELLRLVTKNLRQTNRERAAH
ncbi:hypothetical protein [Evansella halocellulosilytica]|uniref:hypothetical protein n=1 Tax=Evansella halocellulosilytica TaxID=2011013 RepID=UPI0011552855|nr:hypothetical protein [Evansella halocellulosilytica]